MIGPCEFQTACLSECGAHEIQSEERMKYWEQDKKTNDCGPCCVAMLTDVDPKTVLKQLSTRNDGTTTAKHIRDFLLSFGFLMGKMKRIGLGRTNFESRDINCLLATQKRNDRNWHWMVWDAAGRQVLDPLRPKRQRFPGNLRGYYEVRKVGPKLAKVPNPP